MNPESMTSTTQAEDSAQGIPPSMRELETDKRELQQQEYRKARVRARVEHPFQAIKRFFRYTKVRCKELAKNTAHILMRFALANLHRERKKLMAMTGSTRPAHAG